MKLIFLLYGSALFAVLCFLSGPCVYGLLQPLLLSGKDLTKNGPFSPPGPPGPPGKRCKAWTGFLFLSSYPSSCR